MGGVVDAIGDVVGGAADVVGDVAGGAIDLVGDVVETIADNPELALIGGIFAAPYLAPELFYGTAAGTGAGGAGILGADIAAAGSLGYVPGAEAAAGFASGGGFNQFLFGSIPELSAAAIAEGAVPVASQGVLGAGGVFNPFSGSVASNVQGLFPSTDFVSSFIPKTPADIAKTLGQAVLLGGATQIPQPQVPGVDMNVPPSNVPQYGTGRSIFNAYNSSKQNINNILYPQGLLGTQQPRTAGIYSDYLQQQGLI
jgi:hypothetical protein